MSKHTLKWQDGTEVEFEDFDSNTQQVVYCKMPNTTKRNRYNQYSSYLYISKKDYDEIQAASCYNNRGYINKDVKKVDAKLIRVGVLRENTAHGFPAGCYIPYRQNNNGAEHFMEGLTGEFIINPKYAKQTQDV